MRTRSFIISTLGSTLLQSLYYVVVTGLTLLLFPSLMDTISQDFLTTGAPPAGFSGFIGISAILSIAGLILAPLTYAATGALYAYLHRREDAPVTPEQGALGGAVAAFTARFLTGMFIAGASLIVAQFMMGSLTNGLGDSGISGVPPNITAISGVMNVFSSLVGTCFGAMIAAALGGLGGALTGAMLK